MHSEQSEQKAQLLQRCRSMLRIIRYFAKSLIVNQGHWKMVSAFPSNYLVLSWRVISRPPHAVSRQWPWVVRYGMRHATGASLSSWFLKAAGLSCSITTTGSWFQSPTVLAANELRSSDEDAPIALNLNRWFALVLLSAATKPIWSGPTATCPVTTLYNKATLRSRQRSLRSRQPRSCSMWVTLDVVLWSPLTNLADRRCIFSSKSQSPAKWWSQTGAAYSKVERTNVMYAVSLSLAGQRRRFLLKKPRVEFARPYFSRFDTIQYTNVTDTHPTSQTNIHCTTA